MDKDTFRLMYPAGIASPSFVFSQKALQWQCGATKAIFIGAIFVDLWSSSSLQGID